MLGLLVALIASLAPAPVTCADGPASCQAEAMPQAVADDDAGESATTPRLYATPAEVECPVPYVPTVMQALVGAGECDGTPRDASYRASRYPESERNAGTVAPGGQGRERRPALVACDGVPRDGGGLTISAPQPLALFALPDLAPQSGNSRFPDLVFALSARAIEPPQRPPQA